MVLRRSVRLVLFSVSLLPLDERAGFGAVFQKIIHEVVDLGQKGVADAVSVLVAHGFGKTVHKVEEIALLLVGSRTPCDHLGVRRAAAAMHR